MSNDVSNISIENNENIVTTENIEHPTDTVQHVLDSALHWIGSRDLQEYAFPLLEQALAALMTDIERNVALIQSGDYYRNPPKEPLSSLFQAASFLVQEMEFRKAMYWKAKCWTF